MDCKICQCNKVVLFTKIKNFTYYLCPRCTTLFLNPFPTIKIVNDFYKNNFTYQAGLANKERTDIQSKIILNKLKQLNPEGKSLLDIGSGFGYFLKNAENSNLKTTGIEPSKQLFDVALRRNRKIKLFNETLQNYLLKNKQKFDFITLIHVIEHLPDPIKTIKSLTKRLNKNGVLYIETPNLNSHLFRSEKENYTFLTPPEHLWIFSFKSFKKIVKQCELKIIHASTYSYSEHLMGIIKKKFEARNTKSETIVNVQNINDKNVSNLKYKLFDRLLAPLLTPLLNLNQYGSILELYIKKK